MRRISIGLLCLFLAAPALAGLRDVRKRLAASQDALLGVLSMPEGLPRSQAAARRLCHKSCNPGYSGLCEKWMMDPWPCEDPSR